MSQVVVLQDGSALSTKAIFFFLLMVAFIVVTLFFLNVVYILFVV